MQQLDKLSSENPCNYLLPTIEFWLKDQCLISTFFTKIGYCYIVVKMATIFYEVNIKVYRLMRTI